MLHLFLCLAIGCSFTGVESRFSVVPFPRKHDKGVLCGVLCSERAISILKQSPSSLDDLISTKFISSDKGSTAEDIRRLLFENGLKSDWLINLSPAFLSSLNTPAILHVKSDTDVENFEHWLLFLGAKAGEVRIADLPGEAFEISEVELQAIWDGSAIVIHRDENWQVWPLVVWFVVQVLPMIALVAVSFALGTGILNRIKNRISFRFQGVALICVSSLILCIGRNCFFGDGIFRSRVASEILFRPSRSLTTIVEMADLEELCNTENVVFVDARMPQDFAKSHAGNAINIPIHCSFGDRKEITSDIPASTPMIVYCQTERCGYAEIVANRLSKDGFRDVKVFVPGWVKLGETKKN